MMPRTTHASLVIAEVKAREPREVYAELLTIQQTNNFKPGWVAHKFKEIFGGWPRPSSKVEPREPDRVLVEYLGIMKRRWRAQKKREERANGYAEAAE